MASLDEVFNFDDLKPLRVLNDSVEYRKFYDQTSGFSATTGKNHFHFRVSDINSFWLLHRAYLLFEFEIPVNGTQRSTLANGLGNMFHRCILRLGDTEIEDLNQYAYRAIEVDMMTLPKHYAEAAATAMLYTPEHRTLENLHTVNGSNAVYVKPGGTVTNAAHLINDPNSFDVVGSPENNNYTITKAGHTYAMIPIQHIFNFPKVYQKVIRGLDIELEFYLNNDKIRLIKSKIDTAGAAANTTDSVLNWKGSGISLYIPRIKPSARVEAEFNKKLIGSPFRIPVEFEKVRVYQDPIAIGVKSAEWSVTTNTSTPTSLYLFLVQQNTETDQTVNLRHRTNLLQSVSVFVNGERVPTEDLKAEGDPGSGLPQRNFTQYFRQWQNMQGNFDGIYNDRGMVSGSHMDYITFDINNVVAVDLRQSNRPLLDKSSDIRVTYELDSTTTNAHYLYAVLYSKARVDFELSEGRSMALVR